MEGRRGGEGVVRMRGKEYDRLKRGGEEGR